MFGVLSLGFGFGFLLCLDDAVCVVGEYEFSLWCGAKKHHAALFLSDDAMDLPMAPQTRPFFTLQSLTHQAAPPPEA